MIDGAAVLRSLLPPCDDGEVGMSARAVEDNWRMTYTTPPYRDEPRFGAFALIHGMAMRAVGWDPRAITAIMDHELGAMRRMARQQQREWRRRCDPVWEAQP